jgi:hypothetical protein
MMKLFSQHNMKPFDNGLNNINLKVIRNILTTSCMINELFSSSVDFLIIDTKNTFIHLDP